MTQIASHRITVLHCGLNILDVEVSKLNVHPQNEHEDYWLCLTRSGAEIRLILQRR